MSALQEDRNATKADVYWLVGWTAVLLWDNIVTISAAHRYLMKAKRTPMKILYILNRYGTVVFQSMCMMMVVLAVPMNLCRSIFWFQCFALVYVITICSIILSIRCWALFERSRRMMVFLLLMLAIELGLLIGTVSQLRPLVLTPGASIILDFQGCVAVAASSVTRKLSIVFWSTALAFNTVIFILTMWKSISITKRIGQHISIWKRFHKAGIIYYVVILATNLACMIFYTQTKKPLQTFNTPASVVLVSLMSSRLIVFLWSENCRSSRLSIDTFTSFRSPTSPRPPTSSRIPFSPKSNHSSRTKLGIEDSSNNNKRRDSGDYDKIGPLETFKIDITSSDLKTHLPTLSYYSAAQLSPQQQRKTSPSIHSNRGSIVDHAGAAAGGLPKFDGIIVEPFQEIKLSDVRSVRSEGANKKGGIGSRQGSVSRGRDGTASV